MKELIEKLEHQMGQGLPGIDAHQLVMSYPRPGANELPPDLRSTYRESAVMVLFYPERDAWNLVLILRPPYEGVHGSQVSFPGGKLEPEDNSPEAGALRETQEEVGIEPGDVQLLGRLTEVIIPPSQFIVTPVVGFMEYRPNFVPDPREVAEVIEYPLDHLLRKEAIGRTQVDIAHRKMKLDVGYFDANGQTVWGATAMMLAELRAVILGYV